MQATSLNRVEETDPLRLRSSPRGSLSRLTLHGDSRQRMLIHAIAGLVGWGYPFPVDSPIVCVNSRTCTGIVSGI